MNLVFACENFDHLFDCVMEVETINTVYINMGRKRNFMMLAVTHAFKSICCNIIHVNM